MTKQEYEAALKYTMDTDRPPWRDIAIHQAKNNYIASLEKDKLELNAQCFHKDETISVLKNRITELKETIDRIYDVSMKKDHEFGLTYQYANDIIKQKAEIDMLKQDNQSLVEQMNQMALRMDHNSGTTQRSCKS